MDFTLTQLNLVDATCETVVQTTHKHIPTNIILTIVAGIVNGAYQSIYILGLVEHGIWISLRQE